jgi:hypothetical protein
MVPHVHLVFFSTYIPTLSCSILAITQILVVYIGFVVGSGRPIYLYMMVENNDPLSSAWVIENESNLECNISKRFTLLWCDLGVLCHFVHF